MKCTHGRTFYPIVPLHLPTSRLVNGRSNALVVYLDNYTLNGLMKLRPQYETIVVEEQDGEAHGTQV